MQIKVVPKEEYPAEHLERWLQRLIEPELLEQAVFFKVEGNNFTDFWPAIPVGKFRKSGSFDFCWPDYQVVVDILKDRPGFPDLRVIYLWHVVWGEELLSLDEISGAEYWMYSSRMFGYREEAIQQCLMAED